MGENNTKPFELKTTITTGNGEEVQQEQKMPMNTLDIIAEAREKGLDKENLKRPLTTKDTPQIKMYLILSEYSYNDHDDDKIQYIRDWEIFYGTTQDLYDHLIILITDDGVEYDVMKSRLLVNGENTRLKNNASVYQFMKMQIERGNAVDETDFDIEDYYYELPEDEEEFYHGKETW